MLGSRLSLDSLAEWIEWRAWAVQSWLWASCYGRLRRMRGSKISPRAGTAPPFTYTSGKSRQTTQGEMSDEPGHPRVRRTAVARCHRGVGRDRRRGRILVIRPGAAESRAPGRLYPG